MCEEINWLYFKYQPLNEEYIKILSGKLNDKENSKEKIYNFCLDEIIINKINYVKNS